MNIFLTFALLLISESYAQSLGKEVLERNLSIQSYQLSKEAEEVKTGHLNRSFLPTVMMELGQERFQTGTYSSRSEPYGLLEARFNLFRGGRDRIRSQMVDLQAQIAEHNKNLAIRSDLSKVRKLQFQIIFHNELIALLEKEKKENLQILRQAQKRASSGVSTKSDSLEFNIYDLELTEKIESLNHENKILKIGLLPLLGLTEIEDLKFQEKLEHQHDDQFLERQFAFRNHPLVASLDAEHENFNFQKKANELWWTPNLDLYGGYYLYTLRDRDYIPIGEREDRVFGVRLSFLLFDGLAGHNLASSNHYQGEAKRLMARHTERQTEAQFLMLKEELKHTHEVMHYVLERINKSREYLRLTLFEYDRGVKNSLDALLAMQRYYRYEKEYLEKKKEYQLIKTDLLALLGE